MNIATGTSIILILSTTFSNGFGQIIEDGWKIGIEMPGMKQIAQGLT